ncbi:MAG: mammalian cell entry protein [Mycolicibacterium hassiacum]|uniref:mammalian cell entry protein n=1 Tax=Mycolicibacterium hassiacum TaxID=46351 RepID=UPI0023F7BC2C|nr:mammalian cell entry protein [Mycolicibacterium hassiacum]MBX5485335.1 mammalian cell entry protein [Mycolicibacterium hassiacum]
MTDESTSDVNGSQTTPSATPRPRRRAARPPGPAGDTGAAGSMPAGVAVRPTVDYATVRVVKPAAPRPRAGHRRLVAVVALVVLSLAGATLGGLAYWMHDRQRAEEQALAREQRFVDTASQLVVNMFSYDQESIDESVDRFVASTSGPLNAMLTQDNNTEFLKMLFRGTNASSEAAISGAALEKLDEVSKNAAVLVAAKVTITDLDGNNLPTQFYRFRVIVHEDESGRMTGYDVKYPDGGN